MCNRHISLHAFVLFARAVREALSEGRTFSWTCPDYARVARQARKAR